MVDEQILIIQFNLMQEQVQKVKIITLKDSKNKEEKYMLSENILGKGKYGKVYRATHVDNPNKIFAVKVIKVDSPRIREECLRELQIIRHLPKSLNLVQIHSQHMESNNNFYLFEEYCNGGNLYEQKFNRKGKAYSEEEVYNIFFQVVSGFLDLRRSNIFHEDIKPQNIMIKNNLYKLTDFGISQLSDQIEVSQIRRGTLIYMPPQKLKGNTYTPTSKSQIYSLGVTLFEVIFGHHPYLKKKPQDYKEYLKLIQQSQIKSIEQLKSIYPSHTLSMDKLIRTILRMIELNEAKRLSLEELEDYIKNTQPFKSMVISEIEPIARKKNVNNIKYEAVGHSNVIVRSQNGMGELLRHNNEKSKKQKIDVSLGTFRICLQIFRDSSGFFQQGLFFAKDSSFHELKKIQSESSFDLNKVPRLTEIQFMSLLFIERMFGQLAKLISTFIFQSQNQMNCEGLEGVQDDKEYISNEFLNFLMELEQENKKSAWTYMKEKGNALGATVADELQKVFSNINCVRINFKQDMLTVLFLKYGPTTFRLIKSILDQIVSGSIDSIMDVLGSSEYEKVKINLLNFSNIQNQKKERIKQFFDNQMKGLEILQDDQSNSDQFQLLQDPDLQ